VLAVEKKEPLALSVGMQTDTTTVENSTEVPHKLKIELPSDPAIALLGIYQKKTKTLIQKDICNSMFIAALFTLAKIWKQHKCSLIH